MAYFRCPLVFFFALLIFLVNGSPIEQDLEPRGLSAIVCALITGIIKEVKSDAKVTSHCSSFLKIPASTVIETSRTTSTIVSSTTLTIVTTTQVITTVPTQTTTTVTSTTTTTMTSTVSEGATSVTAPQVTQTITTLIPETHCIPDVTTVLKRDMGGYVSIDRAHWTKRQEVEARATKKSGLEIVKSLQAKVASTVCGCISIPTARVTSTSNLISTTTVRTTFSATATATSTSTVRSTSTSTSTVTITESEIAHSIVPLITITVPPQTPTVTEKATITTSLSCTFKLRTRASMLANHPAKVHQAHSLFTRSPNPVRFSTNGTDFTLDTEGHLLDDRRFVAVVQEHVDGIAAVDFRAPAIAKNESMLVCGGDESDGLECRVGDGLTRLAVCLPDEEEFPGMYVVGAGHDRSCFSGGYRVEVQEL